MQAGERKEWDYGVKMTINGIRQIVPCETEAEQTTLAQFDENCNRQDGSIHAGDFEVAQKALEIIRRSCIDKTGPYARAAEHVLKDLQGNASA